MCEVDCQYSSGAPEKLFRRSEGSAPSDIVLKGGQNTNDFMDIFKVSV